jgi:multidrug/hemolysin transport system ATP-binding protein
LTITVRNLTKRYKTLTAVDDLSFDVAIGTVFAFVGTNGAGKSTTIGCLTTILPFQTGEVRVAGFDVQTEGERVREQIGVVFQESVLDPGLTVRENLALRARLAHLDPARTRERIEVLSDLVELRDFLTRRYGTLSGGQRRRVDIARALLHEPKILFLDEPTAGLDPASRNTVWRTLDELRRGGGLTVFLTTHYMEETEEADRVCIIDRGHLIADGTPAQLRAAHSHSILTVSTSEPEALARLADAHGTTLETDADTFLIRVTGSQEAMRILTEHGDAVRDFEFRHGRMDDVFLALTGRTGDEPAEVEEDAA